jgi:Bacteriophage HK97-gp10, putative tail-component
VPESVEFKGFDEAEAELEALPGQLRRAAYEATRDAAKVLLDAFRSNTPVAGVASPRMRKGTAYPAGALLRGWGSRVEQTVDGAEGRVTNKVYYGPFVERGAHPGRPMRANPITARGVALATGTVEAIYDAKIREVVELADRA